MTEESIHPETARLHLGGIFLRVDRVRSSYLVPIGGGSIPSSVIRTIGSLSRRDSPTALIIPAASQLSGDRYLQMFHGVGIRAEVLELRSRADAGRERILAALESGDILFFTGGDQLRLARALRDTPSEQVLRRRLSEGVVIAGTSAGAAVMGELMPAGGTGRGALVSGGVQEGQGEPGDDLGPVVIAEGLGLVGGLIVDQHFFARGRFGRLAYMVTRYREREMVGLGIDESTAVVIDPAAKNMLVIGDGSVAAITAPVMGYDNVDVGGPMASFGLTVDVLSWGNGYDFAHRRPLHLEDARELVAATLE